MYASCGFHPCASNITNKASGSDISAPVEDAHNLNLIFGARHNQEGSEIQYKTAFKLEDAREYDFAMDESDVLQLYGELAED